MAGPRWKRMREENGGVDVEVVVIIVKDGRG